MLAALSFRRATDARASEWIAALTIAPVVQIPAILWLCVLPTSYERASAPSVDGKTRPYHPWAASAQGVIAGAAVILAGVALSALVFGAYGYGIFMASPFVVGFTTAFFANRRSDIGPGPTIGLALFACVLGGIALVAGALEGIVCLVLAAPIAAAMAAAGAFLGRMIAARKHSARRQTLIAVAALPLLFALDGALPPSVIFETRQTILIDAAPSKVWQALVGTDRVYEPPSLPFRLGVAYPLYAETGSGGVGSLRRGHFSTGIAIERITEWEPERELAFEVLEDVPSMRELSPYEVVHAPHVDGYFRTLQTRFELKQVTATRGELIEETSHELRLNPVLYWLPLARLIVDQNNSRVLRHVQRVATTLDLSHQP